MDNQLRPHQVEAVDVACRALEFPATSPAPEEGLRAQVIAACGTGKTRIAAGVAQRLRAGRVLVLVPTLDLLVQTVAAWREAGRSGAVLGVCSLRGDTALGFPSTTDADELVAWCKGLERVTVFATYASLGVGTLERAHAAGLEPWDLVIVDEAHRTSGAAGKPWAAIHDQGRVPAVRRLYMTATPRLWEPDGDGSGDSGAGSGEGPSGGRLVASMDDETVFGPVAFELSLSEAIERGLVAPYRVICVDVADPAWQAAVLTGADVRSVQVRGARLAAVQTAVLKAAAEYNLARVLTFHHRTSEAEAFAAGLPAVAEQLHRREPGLYPKPGGTWARWLCGEHDPAWRRQVLGEFETGIVAGGDVVERCLLSSVRVLGEGVDTRACDAVAFADVRGSMPDIVQAVGRALRMQPGQDKVASLVVPVLLGPGEGPDAMLTSNSYDGLARLLAALRAHDARVVEALAAPQAAGRATGTGTEQEGREQADGDRGEDEGARVGRPARELLVFSTPRDPALLARFVTLRVLRPERAAWRRGLAAAVAYHGEHGDLRVPYGHMDAAGFPLGRWIAEQRRAHGTGRLPDGRVAELEELGMVWSHTDIAWQEGLEAARRWADQHGVGLAAPADAVWRGYPVGVWLKNQRAAARTADQIAARLEAGLPVDGYAGALTEERRELLEEIDPAWCPAWPVNWQRAFVLARRWREAGGNLGELAPGQTVGGEDLGQWVRAQRAGWDKLTAAQQWMLEHILGLNPADRDEAPRRTSHADKFATNLAAARQYHAREGHLRVPRKHIEHLGGGRATGGEKQAVKLGVWVANVRSRRAKLPAERAAALEELGMRWA
ncbi:Helicase associated domain protein [Streptomyces sp. NPDC059506]|uniref:DEAD/DEAH box helicase n=1 Tax=Streptomyces sp. NPDC059506 TaxID=3347751 RepID=UPI003685AB03